MASGRGSPAASSSAWCRRGEAVAARQPRGSLRPHGPPQRFRSRSGPSGSREGRSALALPVLDRSAPTLRRCYTGWRRVCRFRPVTLHLTKSPHEAGGACAFTLCDRGGGKRARAQNNDAAVTLGPAAARMSEDSLSSLGRGGRVGSRRRSRGSRGSRLGSGRSSALGGLGGLGAAAAGDRQDRDRDSEQRNSDLGHEESLRSWFRDCAENLRLLLPMTPTLCRTAHPPNRNRP